MGSRLLQNGLPVETEAIDAILSMPFTQRIFTEGISSDPFINELGRIRHSMECLVQKHKQKRSKLRLQCEKEMEGIKRKYDLLLEIEDATFKKEKMQLAELRGKVESGLSVDKEFTEHSVEQMGLYASHPGQIPEQLRESTVAYAPPTDQVEVFRSNSIAGPIPPGATVEQLNSNSIFDAAPYRNLNSTTGGCTGTSGGRDWFRS